MNERQPGPPPQPVVNPSCPLCGGQQVWWEWKRMAWLRWCEPCQATNGLRRKRDRAKDVSATAER